MTVVTAGRVRCPKCDELVRRKAQVCRYCGCDLAQSQPSMGGAEREQPAQAAPENGQPSAFPWRGMPWYRSWWVRGPVLALFLVDAGLASLTPENWVDQPIPVRILAGAAVVFVGGLMVFALLVWGGLRLAGRNSSYTRVLLSFPLILLVWLGAESMSVNRAENNPGQPSILQSVDETKRKAEAQKQRQLLIKQRGEFSAWFSDYIAAIQLRMRSTMLINKWGLMADPFSGEGMAALAQAKAKALAFKNALLDLDSYQGLQSAYSLSLQSAKNLMDAIALLQALPNNPDMAETRGAEADRLIALSERQVRKAGRIVDAEYRRLGGIRGMPELQTQVDQLYRLAKSAN